MPDIKVFKYEFSVKGNDTVIINIPHLCYICKIGKQNPEPGALTLWAAVLDVPLEETDQPEPVILRIFGTGRTIPAKYTGQNFITTVIDGPAVWHIYRSYEYLEKSDA